MEQNKEEIQVVQPYTRAAFLTQVFDSFTQPEEDVEKQRDNLFKRKIINYLNAVEKDIPIYDPEKPESFESVIDKFNNFVQENGTLFGYTFFLASNRNFNYSWGYLRKQMEEYIKTLALIFKALDYIVGDINAIREKLIEIEKISLIFNNLYCVKFLPEAPYATIELLWDNFNTYFANVHKGYYVSAKYNKTTLLTTFREYKDKEFNFADSVLKLIKMWEAQDKR